MVLNRAVLLICPVMFCVYVDDLLCILVECRMSVAISVHISWVLLPMLMIL